MTKTITQKVVFKNSTPEQLYELYMDAKKHALVSGAPAKISAKGGAAFSAHGGYISGKIFEAIPGKSIVQSWRAKGWGKNELDSTFMLQFEKKGKDTVLNMVHANIPNAHVAGIKKGWNNHYWNLWKQHLAGKTIVRPKM
jgi:activator of HSP90 ATPase